MTTATAATVAAVLLIGVPGTAIGATTARPGESLWKVKLGLERVRLAVAAGPERDAEVHVDLATARLSELAGLVGTEATPEVVGEVSDDLGSHARAADDALGDVGSTASRDALQRRLTDVKHKQVVVMDTLLGAECGDDEQTDCVALAETRDETVELRDTTDGTVAVAVPVEEDTAEASPPPTSVAQADAAATTPADDETTDGDPTTVAAADAPQPTEPATVASEPPAAGAATPPPAPADAQPSESPSPSATPTPAPSPSGESAGQASEAPASETAAPVPSGPVTPDALEAQASQD